MKSRKQRAKWNEKDVMMISLVKHIGYNLSISWILLINVRILLPAVNFLLLGLKYSGHMSTIPVTKLSTIQNSLSMPIVYVKRYGMNINEIWMKKSYYYGFIKKLISFCLFLLTTNIRKNVTAHIGPPGSFSTTSG